MPWLFRKPYNWSSHRRFHLAGHWRVRWRVRQRQGNEQKLRLSTRRSRGLAVRFYWVQLLGPFRAITHAPYARGPVVKVRLVW